MDLQGKISDVPVLSITLHQAVGVWRKSFVGVFLPGGNWFTIKLLQPHVSYRFVHWTWLRPQINIEAKCRRGTQYCGNIVFTFAVWQSINFCRHFWFGIGAVFLLCDGRRTDVAEMYVLFFEVATWHSPIPNIEWFMVKGTITWREFHKLLKVCNAVYVKVLSKYHLISWQLR